MKPFLTDLAMKEMQEQQQADDRVWHLMDLICAEFASDPLSRACFDERIVEEAIELVKRRRKMRDAFNPFNLSKDVPTPPKASTGEPTCK